MQADYDVAIVGGGMTGAALACALAGGPLRVALIEAVPARNDAQPSYDDRGLSLALSSQRILGGLELWPALAREATPIEHIHVSDRGRFGFVRLHAADLGVPALGYVVPARILGRALLAGVAGADNVEFLCPAEVARARPGPARVELEFAAGGPVRGLSCRLLVIADGTRSALREALGMEVEVRDYGQTAIVATVTPERPHANWAYERFTDTGPLALLPLTQGRCAMVYTVPAAAAPECQALSDSAFLERVQARFGLRLGRLRQPGARKAYPLQRLAARVPLGQRLVLLGNAAHTVHPNAAQGFNLGLRDAAALAEQLAAASDPGAPEPLQAWHGARRRDQDRVLRFTDSLARLFASNRPERVILRDAGMLLTDLLPGLKRGLMRRAMGFQGRQPQLVLGAPLPGDVHGH